jgi:hypothetical protein
MIRANATVVNALIIEVPANAQRLTGAKLLTLLVPPD